jgi:hypothetical protein
MKQFWKPVSLCAAVVTVAVGFLLTACGSGGGSKIRFLSLSPDSQSLNVIVDGKTITNALGFGVATNYTSISSGTRHIQFEPVGTTTNVIDQMVNITSGTNNTYVVEGFASNLMPFLYVDNQTAPPTGNCQLRVINAAASLGNRDIYVVPNGTDINTVSPTLGNAPIGAATSYLNLPAGSYAIYFAQPGFKIGYVSSGAITLTANTNRTIIGYTSPFGFFTTITLADLN